MYLAFKNFNRTKRKDQHWSEIYKKFTKNVPPTYNACTQLPLRQLQVKLKKTAEITYLKIKPKETTNEVRRNIFRGFE